MWKLTELVGKSHWEQKDLDQTLLISSRSLDFSFQEVQYGKFVLYHHRSCRSVGWFFELFGKVEEST